MFQRQCLPTYAYQCANFFSGGNGFASSELFQYSVFPNARDLPLTDAIREFGDFNPLLILNNYCSYLLHSFLCIHYFPPCDPTSNHVKLVVPCRAVCEEAMLQCLNFVYDHYNIPSPPHLNCTNFPLESSDLADVIVACPTPGMLFMYSLGKFISWGVFFGYNGYHKCVLDNSSTHAWAAVYIYSIYCKL